MPAFDRQEKYVARLIPWRRKSSAAGTPASPSFKVPQIHVLPETSQTIACDIGRARRELGYEPTVALEEGMRRSIRDALARGLSI